MGQGGRRRCCMYALPPLLLQAMTRRGWTLHGPGRQAKLLLYMRCWRCCCKLPLAQGRAPVDGGHGASQHGQHVQLAKLILLYMSVSGRSCHQHWQQAQPAVSYYIPPSCKAARLRVPNERVQQAGTVSSKHVTLQPGQQRQLMLCAAGGPMPRVGCSRVQCRGRFSQGSRRT